MVHFPTACGELLYAFAAVRHHYDGSCSAQLFERGGEQVAVGAVEVRERLVEYDEARSRDKGTGYQGSLHLTAGEVAEHTVEQFRKAEMPGYGAGRIEVFGLRAAEAAGQ